MKRNLFAELTEGFDALEAEREVTYHSYSNSTAILLVDTDITQNSLF